MTHRASLNVLKPVSYRRFRDWARTGVFGLLFNGLSDSLDLEMAMIDATTIKVHRAGQSGKKGPPVKRWKTSAQKPEERSLTPGGRVVTPKRRAMIVKTQRFQFLAGPQKRPPPGRLGRCLACLRAKVSLCRGLFTMTLMSDCTIHILPPNVRPGECRKSKQSNKN